MADPVLARFVDVPLMAHPQCGPGPVGTLTVSGTLRRSGLLQLDFGLAAELNQLRFVPSACHAQRRDELWHHTCFELFAGRAGEAEYCEFNFTPAGDWAAYVFAGYRDSRRDAAQRRVDVTARASGDGRLQLHARVDLTAALGLDAGALEQARWQLNCAAVIERNDGTLDYWAVHHPKARPDFHDRDGFRIALEPAPAAEAEPAATAAPEARR
jgi:hypothetical protein